MRFPLICLTVTATLFLFSACTKYETQFEGPYEDGPAGVSPTVKYFYDIACVQGGSLYLVDRLLRGAKKMPVSGTVKSAAINYSHDRIAWKTASGDIAILDSTGVQLEVVPNSATVKWFDWHPNNRTLYMLFSDNKIKTHGNAVTLATNNADASVPFFGNTTITSIALRSDGSTLIGYSVYDGLNYQNGIYTVYAPGSGANSFVNTFYRIPSRIRLSAQGVTAAVTTTDISGFNPESFEYAFGSGNLNNSIGSGVGILAINPEASKSLMVTNGNTNIYDPYKGKWFTPGTGVITDLDW